MKNKQMEVESSSSALEEDSKRMEERLRMLKKMMSVEKASRIAKYGSSGGSFWKSSQNDPQTSSRRNTSTTGSVDKKCVRVKVLVDEGEGTVKVKRCGQCDKTAAKLVCIECTENYCLACFAKFHQKGALSKHRVKPLTKKVRGTAKELPSAKTSCVTSTTTSTPGVQTGCDGIKVNERSRRVDGGERNEGSGLLLEGEYDEQASAQSFQEALAEWRAGSKGQLQDPTKTPGTDTSAVVPPTSQTCSTQTSDVSELQSLTVDSQESGVHFGKYSGGVSYLERLMVRRHCSDPHFHIPDHCQNKHRLKETDEEGKEGEREGERREEEERGRAVREGGERMVSDAEEMERRDSQNQVPSQYNLFHSGIRAEECSGLPPSVAGSECTTTLSSRPTSSVQIEEVKFTNYCDKSPNLKQHNDDSHNDEKKGTSNSKGHSSCRGKERRHLSQRKKPKEKRQQKHTSKPCQGLSTAGKHSSPVGGSFSTVIQVLKQHKVVTTTSHDHEKLSDFFLCGVNCDDTITGNVGGESRESVQEANSSKLSLPISATIWLPDNSVPSEVEPTCTSREDPYSLVPASTSPDTDSLHSDNLKPNPLFHHPNLPSSSTNPPSHCLSPPSSPDSSPHSSHNPLLGTSIYHIATDLPPPSRTKQQVWCSYSFPGKPSTTSNASTSQGRRSSSLTDSESDDEDIIEYLGDYLGEDNEGYGEDSEALDELAWELQSLTGGRLTRCEGEWEEEEGKGGGVGEGEGGEVEEGEGGGVEELEAGIERVKSSFEIYHQQLMQQDSD